MTEAKDVININYENQIIIVPFNGSITGKSFSGNVLMTKSAASIDWIVLPDVSNDIIKRLRGLIFHDLITQYNYKPLENDSNNEKSKEEH